MGQQENKDEPITIKIEERLKTNEKLEMSSHEIKNRQPPSPDLKMSNTSLDDIITKNRDKKILLRSITSESDKQSINDVKTRRSTITFIDFLENHQSIWAVFSLYFWYFLIFLFSILLRMIGISTSDGHSISPLEILRLVSLIPICLHLYHYIQQNYFPFWSSQPFRVWQIGDLFIFLVTTISSFIFFYSSVHSCTTPLCVKDQDGLQSGLLLQSVVVAILVPILVKAHSIQWVAISYLISFAFTLTTAIITDRSVPTLFTIALMYSLGSIVLYDNEQTLHLLYLHYINHEENLMMKLKTTNEKELLLMKGEELRYLIGNVAHDLKSPLHGFSMELETLRKRLDASQDTESIESIVALRRICSFLLMTINRAIDYSKASSGMLLVPSLETVDINATMNWVVKCVSPLNELPIKVEPLPESMCVNVITDKHWLTENLLCLVSNAQKFTGEGSITLRYGLEYAPEIGTISPNPLSRALSSRELNTQVMVRIEVEDSGIGIRPEERLELFQPFKQAQRRVGGTGLGLYSLLKRVEALGGSCGVTDRRDGGNGSLFWFNFPYRPDESANQIITPPSPRDQFLDLFTNQSPSVNSPRSIEKTSHGDLVLQSFPSPEMKINSPPMKSPNFHLDSANPEDNFNINTPSRATTTPTTPPITPTLVPPIAPALAPAPPATTATTTQASAADQQITPPQKEEKMKPTAEPNKRILLVEDSVLIQKTTSRALKNEGYVVDIARNGLECLKMVKDHDYSFILMDIQMPVMDGIEATKRLREMEKSDSSTPDDTKNIKKFPSNDHEEESERKSVDNSHLAEGSTSEIIHLFGMESLLNPEGLKFDNPRKFIIIGLSASSDTLTMDEALHAGMNEFLSKPLSVSSLKICFQRFSPLMQQFSMGTT